jgi:integrase
VPQAGLRVGEALGLEVSAIDFLARNLAVTQQAVTVRRVTTLAPPKTSASVRTVPLADVVLTELASWLKRHPRSSHDLLMADANGDLKRPGFSGGFYAWISREDGVHVAKKQRCFASGPEEVSA